MEGGQLKRVVNVSPGVRRYPRTFRLQIQKGLHSARPLQTAIAPYLVRNAILGDQVCGNRPSALLPPIGITHGRHVNGGVLAKYLNRGRDALLSGTRSSNSCQRENLPFAMEFLGHPLSSHSSQCDI